MKEIIFKDITLQNFLSIGNSPLKIEFNRGLNYCVGWNYKNNSSNGVGKSAIFYTAPLYALFGDSNRKNIKQDSVINYNNKKDMFVELNIEYNGNQVKIYRGRKPNIFYYEINGKRYQNDKSSETQRELLSYLNISEDIFKNIFIINASSILEFIEDTGSVKLRERFEKMFFKDIIFKKILEGARKKLNNINSDISIKSKSKEEIESFINQLNLLLNELESNETFNGLIERNKNQLETLKRKLDSFNIEDKKIKENKLKEIDIAIEKLIESLNVDIMNLHVFKDNIKTADKKVKTINKSGDTCPVCLSKLNKEKQDEIKQHYNNYIKEKTSLIEKLEVKIKTAEAKKYKLERYKETFKNSIKELEYKERYGKNELTSKINNIENILKSYDDKLNNKNKIESQIKDINGKLINVDKEISKLQKEKMDLELINSIFNNKDGILIYFIRKVIKSLNKIILKFIREMQLDFTFGFDENLNLVFRLNDKLSIGNFSSGEQKAINFIVFFSLMEFFFKHIELKSSIVVVDETKDTSLSENKINLVFEIFKKFHYENNIGIYFLSHDYSGIHNSIIDFDYVIHLEKRGDFTKISKIDEK